MFRSRRSRWAGFVTVTGFLALLALAVSLSPTAAGATTGPLGAVPSQTIGDGAWSWFEGPRAIVTADGCELLAGSVGGTGDNGNVYVSSWSVGAQVRAAKTLDTGLLHDDHNSAGLVELPGGQVLAAWSGHAQDETVHVAIRSKSGAWTSLPGFATPGPTTYNNVYRLADGTILDFLRQTHVVAKGSTPDLYRSRDNGRTWVHVGALLHLTGTPEAMQRPYVVYAPIGNRVYFVTTQGHPRELAAIGTDSAIFAGYVEGTTIHRSDGAAIGTIGQGVDIESLTPVYVPAAHHAAWSSGMSFGPDGNPVAIFSVRDRNVAWDSPLAIRYLQARYTGAGWSVHDIAPGGRAIYAAEDDYSGNITTDPTNPDHVVVSSTVDPTTSTSLTQYDLFDGWSVDGGATWTWSNLTATSVSEYRPLFTNSADGVQALAWFAGRYDTYMSFSTSVRFRLLDARSPADRAARCGRPRDMDGSAVAGDFDGDSRADVLSYVPGSGPARISWGAPVPDTLLAGQRVDVPRDAQPARGDFNGDGASDLLWYGPGAAHDSIWWGHPSRTFTTRAVSMGGSYRPVTGDFDGNGVTDILWYAPGSGADLIWWGARNGSFSSAPTTVNGTYLPLAGDFDGDHVTDILWYAPGTGGDFTWWGRADRSFTSTAVTVNGSYRPVTGDFDADGASDVLWYAPGTAADAIWWGRVNRSFASTPTAINGEYAPVAGDFDGDRTTDVFWHSTGAPPDTIWSGTARRTFTIAPGPFR